MWHNEVDLHLEIDIEGGKRAHRQNERERGEEEENGGWYEEIVEHALQPIHGKENYGINGKLPRARAQKKKNSKILSDRPIISVVISKTGERVDVTAPGATSFDIFVSKTISGKLHLSFTPWRRARSNSIRSWILLFPWYCRFPVPPLSRFYLAVGDDRVLSKSRGYARERARDYVERV